MSYQQRLRELAAGEEVNIKDPDLTDREIKRLESLLQTRQDAMDSGYVPGEWG